MGLVISRFDIWLAQLDPTVGREIQKTRPCVVVSPDDINEANWTVIVAPMSSQIKKLPTRISIEFENKEGQVLLDQIRAIDPKRLIRRLGRVNSSTSKKILEKLAEMFAL